MTGTDTPQPAARQQASGSRPPPLVPRTSVPGLYLAVFVSGMTGLALEVTASRLLGSVFGTSNIVWANIIGLILLYLAAGYFLGGRWADRSPHARTFYTILAVAGFFSGLIPLVSRPILYAAGASFAAIDVGPVLGSFFAVLVLFAVPVTLLGCASPFAVRLAMHDVRGAGNVAGRMYAVSTLGSIVGTFLPTLWLHGAIGTLWTFLLFAGLLMLVAFAGLWRAGMARRVLLLLWMPLLLAALTALVAAQPLKPAPAGTTLLYARESAYNYIQVIQSGDCRYLLLNEGQGLHSVYCPNGRLRSGGTWDYFLAAPYFNAPPFRPEQVHSLALIGLAAGTISKEYTAVYGPLPITGIEIDPAIVDAGRAWFDMNEPNLRVVVADGRYALAHDPQQYTVIGIDAYRLPYIPWHLTTREFFVETKAHLTGDGALAINVGRTPGDRRLVDALAATIAAVFPSVYVVDVPDTFNTIVYATVQPTARENLRANLAFIPNGDSPAENLLWNTVASAYLQLQPTPTGGVVFTDDRAPVEEITNSVVIGFMLRGGFGR